MHNLSIIGG